MSWARGDAANLEMYRLSFVELKVIRPVEETSLTLFDLEEGVEEKENGMQAAAEARSWILSKAREIAVAIASGRESRCCSADDVMKELIKLGHHPSDLGPAAGSIFRGKSWEFTEEWEESERVSNHARVNRIWRLK